MAHDGQPDEALVRRARAGDETAFRGLVERYLRRAMAVAREFTGTLEDAEDVVQNAFHNMVLALDRFDPARPFRPWFFTILRNAARNAARGRAVRRHETLDEHLADQGSSPLERTEHADLQARLDASLDALPEMQRTCFRLQVLEGLTSGEVADALGVSDATVRTHVHRARLAMRNALEPFADEGERP